MRSCRRQAGFSLLEVILVSAFGMITIFGLVAYSSHWIKLSQQSKNMSQLLHQAHFITHNLSREIKQAGDLSCSPQHKNTQIVQGYSASTANKRYAIQAVAHSDVLLLSGCQRYQQSWQWLNRLFYISKMPHKDDRNHTILGLYEKITTGRRELLADHVTQLRLHFSIRNQSSFYLASQIQHWRNVNGVLVSLVMRSSEPMMPYKQKYWFDRQSMLAPDLNFYSVWQIYARIRRS